MNCLHSFRPEDKSHEKVCKNKDFCRIVMPSENNRILKIDGCANNPEKSSAIEIGEHIPCRY